MFMLTRGRKGYSKLRNLEPANNFAGSCVYRNRIKKEITSEILKEFNLDDFVGKLPVTYKESLKLNLIECNFVNEYIRKQVYNFIVRGKFEFNNEQRYLLRFIEDKDKRKVAISAEAYLEGKIKEKMDLYI